MVGRGDLLFEMKVKARGVRPLQDELMRSADEILKALSEGIAAVAAGGRRRTALRLMR